ncbi:crossover junction endonuclease EME1-like isoform X2 [Ornithodoros turicata]|uniref:crossover junction endonuclease EME1-like isoform X2 n=1 Tax=Ornithodoros turicata TaxID=34597 RepID=UPI003139EEF1
MSSADVIIIDSDEEENRHNNHPYKRRPSELQENKVVFADCDDSDIEIEDASYIPNQIAPDSDSDNCCLLVPLIHRVKSPVPDSHTRDAPRKPVHDISDSDEEHMPDFSTQIHNDNISAVPRPPSNSSSGCEICEVVPHVATETAETESEVIEERTKVRVRRTKEEREAIKRAKEEAKKRKALEQEVARSCRASDCLKYIKVTLDKGLLELAPSNEVADALHALDVRVSVADLPLERTVTWTREIVSLDSSISSTTTVSEIKEEEVVGVLTADQFLYLVAAQREQKKDGVSTLSDYLGNMAAMYGRRTCFILGLDKYFSREKNRQNREYRAKVLGVASRAPKNGISYDGPSLSRDEIEMVIVGLQLSHPFNVYYVDSMVQVSKWIAAFTKAIAERPFKLEKQRRSLHFLAPGGGATRKHDDPVLTWRSQIEQFPAVGKDAADAIVAEYRSPHSLARAYKSCGSEQAAQLLLQDIVVRRGEGPLATMRRVGPKLSSRLHHFLTTQDGSAFFE